MTGKVRVLSALLGFYPPGFRQAHSEEMRQFIRASLARSNSRWTATLLALDIARWSRARVDVSALYSRHGVRHITDYRSGGPMRNIAGDLKHAARLLVQSPAFTIAAILTLALGIGANTAMFTLADATLLRPLQIREPDRLSCGPGAVRIRTSRNTRSARTSSRVSLQSQEAAGSTLIVDGVPILCRRCSSRATRSTCSRSRPSPGGYCCRPTMCRTDRWWPSLGYDYWRTRFGGDPAVIGRTFRANGRPVTIVGVLQKGFRGISLGSNPSLYIPVAVSGQVRTGLFARVDALTHGDSSG